jgi:arylsulfatase A-like enzyme
MVSRLIDNGYTFQNMHYNTNIYCSQVMPLSTGTTPSTHGIVK